MQEKQKKLALYQAEIAKVLTGDSPWDSQVLNEMILKTKETITERETAFAKAREDCENSEHIIAEAV